MIKEKQLLDNGQAILSETTIFEKFVSTELLTPNEMWGKLKKASIEVLEKSRFTDLEQIGVKENLTILTELLQELISLPNSPEHRQGKEKAEMIKKWLNNNGVEARVVPVDNLDETRLANKNGKWYMVESWVGTHPDEYKGVGPNVLMMTHHDTIAKTEEEIVYSYKNAENELHHPWILDDTIHVAASMIAMVEFKKWWTENHEELGLKGTTRLLVTDGEEMNTQGIWSWLQTQFDANKLYPFDATITGESTGTTQNPLNIAWTNRGKNIFELNYTQSESEKSKNTSPSDLFSDFMFRMLIAQLNVWEKSYNKEEQDNREIIAAKPTGISATHGHIDKETVYSYIEARTHHLCGPNMSRNYMDAVFVNDKPEMLRVLGERTGKSFQVPSFTDKEIMSFISIDKKDSSEVSIKFDTGVEVHAGGYNPWSLENGLNFSFLFFKLLPSDVKEKLVKVNWGTDKKPNTVGSSSELVFSNDIDLTKIAETVQKLQEFIDDGRKNHFRFARNVKDLFLTETMKNIASEGVGFDSERKRKIIAVELDVVKWDLGVRPGPPPRDSLAADVDGTVVQTAVNHLRSLVSKIKPESQDEIEVLINAFNAMHDAGPFSYFSELKEKSQAGVVTIGTGNFDLLHGDEYLDPITMICVALQYHGLLPKLVEAFSKEQLIDKEIIKS